MFYYWLADVIHTLNTVAFFGTAISGVCILFGIIEVLNNGVVYEKLNDTRKVVCVCILLVFCICLPLFILLPSSDTAWQIAKHLNQGE